MDLTTLDARIRDRIATEWLTPSQQQVWEALQRFDGIPHRVINVYGAEGTGKTFLGWLMERTQHATYGDWSQRLPPTLSRLTLDNALADRDATRQIRPLVDKFGIRQIILLTRRRVDEPMMPAFELTVTEEDLDHFAANFYRHLNLIVPDVKHPNFKLILSELA